MFKAKNKVQESLFRALALMVVLAVVMLVFVKLSRDVSKLAGENKQTGGLVTLYSSITNYKKTARFNEAQSDSLKKRFAGFWRFETESTNDGAVSKSDLLEFKDNGIVWEVIRWGIRLPSNDTIRLSHVLTAYCNPFSKAPYDPKKTVCETRILEQAFIVGNDTCYGESRIDELWEIDTSGGGLNLNHRHFTSYNSAINDFFPPGIIDIVNNIQLTQCPKQSLVEFAKPILARAAQVAPQAFSNTEMIRDYYVPLVVDELIRRFPDVASILPDSVACSYTVGADGVVVPRLGRMVKRRFDQVLIGEMATWKLSAAGRGGMYTFSIGH